jgi:hypothetical protein
MTTCAKRVSWGMAIAGVLLVGETALFLSRSQAVNGLSGQDVTQIRTRVHGEVWRRYTTPPKSSLANVSRRLWRAWETRIDPPTQWENVSGRPTWKNGQFGFFPEDTRVVSTSDGRFLSSRGSKAVGTSTGKIRGVVCGALLCRTTGCRRSRCASVCYSRVSGPARLIQTR